MNNLLPNTTTATELQRNYRKVVKRVKKSKKPITVLSNNNPDVVIFDYKTFEKKSRKKRGKNDFSEFSGVWTKKEADGFNKVINEMFEQVNLADWK